MVVNLNNGYQICWFKDALTPNNNDVTHTIPISFMSIFNIQVHLVSNTVDNSSTTAKHQFSNCTSAVIGVYTNSTLTIRREQEQGSYFFLVQGKWI